MTASYISQATGKGSRKEINVTKAGKIKVKKGAKKGKYGRIKTKTLS